MKYFSLRTIFFLLLASSFVGMQADDLPFGQVIQVIANTLKSQNEQLVFSSAVQQCLDQLANNQEVSFDTLNAVFAELQNYYMRDENLFDLVTAGITAKIEDANKSIKKGK